MDKKLSNVTERFLRYVKVDTRSADGVESIPMLLVFKNGQLVNKSIGFVSQPEIEKLLQ